MGNTLDLTPFTKTRGGKQVRNLAGFDYGRAIRDILKLDDVDLLKGPHFVKIPDVVDYIENGFLDGLFGPSSDVLETFDAFFAHYQFEMNDLARPDVKRTLEIIYYNKKRS